MHAKKLILYLAILFCTFKDYSLKKTVDIGGLFIEEYNKLIEILFFVKHCFESLKNVASFCCKFKKKFFIPFYEIKKPMSIL